MLEAQDILLCIADHQWTLEALHLVSALARDLEANLLLIKLVPVSHALLLGAPFAYWQYSSQERAEVEGYVATAGDYGVPLSLYVIQYIDFAGVLCDLADRLHPRVVFARPPRCKLPFCYRLMLWYLKRTLARQGVAFYSLENPLETLLWPPPFQPRSVATAAAPPAQTTATLGVNEKNGTH